MLLTDWQALGSCSGMVDLSADLIEIFFDDYETDSITAQNTDAMCISCPVAEQCGSQGRKNKEWGVWGGVYLKDGKTDVARNSHKSEDTWDILKDIHRWL
jgi:hypothetical protein